MDTVGRKKPGHWIALIVVTYLLVELCSLGGLWFLEKTRSIRFTPADTLSNEQEVILSRMINEGGVYTTFSPTLGWEILPGAEKDGFRSNADGLRSDKEYAREQPVGIVRIITFGDSFTHCNDVNNESTWQSIMEQFSPRLEVLNFGVGGYGLDQAYLRYKELGVHYDTDIVLIGYMPENIYRHVSVFRPFYVPETGLPLAKPRFTRSGGGLELIPLPFSTMADYQDIIDNPKTTLRALGKNDFYYQANFESSPIDWSPAVRIIRLVSHKARSSTRDPILLDRVYNEDSEAYKITLDLLDTFYAEVKERGATPVIVITPSQSDLRRYQTDKDKIHSPLLSAIKGKGYDFIDLTELLEDQDVDEAFIPHYSPECNAVVAERLHKALRETISLPNWPEE